MKQNIICYWLSMPSLRSIAFVVWDFRRGGECPILKRYHWHPTFNSKLFIGITKRKLYKINFLDSFKQELQDDQFLSKVGQHLFLELTNNTISVKRIGNNLLNIFSKNLELYNTMRLILAQNGWQRKLKIFFTSRTKITIKHAKFMRAKCG